MSEGYSKALGNRQTQMIAVSMTIGVGLFLGTGGRLQQAGPGLILSYALAGLAAFFVMRAVGELVVYRQTSGSFISYAREFYGPGAGFAVGWANWAGDAMSAIAQITAIGIYVTKWYPDVPQWASAIGAVVVLTLLNMLAVRLFGELQFWFSLLKVLAIVAFLGIALIALFMEPTAGPQNVTELFPNGLAVVLVSVQAALFAYAGMESVAVAAGETKDPEKTLPKVIKGVIAQISVFYLGSLLLLVMVLPWTAYGPRESPFVTVFTHLGIPMAGDLMNLVVLTSALSSCNSQMYSGGRTTRAMSLGGDAPKFLARMSAHNVPIGALLFGGVVSILGVLLNYVVPRDAFEIAVSMSAIGLIATWSMLVLCQMRLRARNHRSAFPMPWAPWSGWFVLTLLAGVLVLMGTVGSPAQRMAVWCMPVVALAIVVGWHTRRRVTQVEHIPL